MFFDPFYCSRRVRYSFFFDLVSIVFLELVILSYVLLWISFFVLFALSCFVHNRVPTAIFLLWGMLGDFSGIFILYSDVLLCFLCCFLFVSYYCLADCFYSQLRVFFVFIWMFNFSKYLLIFASVIVFIRLKNCILYSNDLSSWIGNHIFNILFPSIFSTRCGT